MKEADLNKSALSIRKRRKKSNQMNRSGKKMGKTIENVTDNLLTNYLVKQETERMGAATAANAKSIKRLGAVGPTMLDKNMMSQRSNHKNFKS